MGKCVKCDDRLHPDFMVVIDESLNSQKCVFCYLDKKVITVEDEKTGQVDSYVTKQQAVENYAKYLQRVKNDPKVRELAVKNNDSGLILP